MPIYRFQYGKDRYRQVTEIILLVPISIAILIGLFLVQRKGTAFIGNIFGPVMLLWFLVIGVLGLRGIIGAPNILGAVSPHYALMYLAQSPPGIGFAVLGAAFLTLTGAEAMYCRYGPLRTRYIKRDATGSAD